MDKAILAEIEDLRQMKVGELRTRYREVFGEESRSSNKQFLFRRIAWRLQANVEGDLSERVRRRALESRTTRIFESVLQITSSWAPLGVTRGPHLIAPGRDEIVAFLPLVRCSPASLRDRRIVVKVLEGRV